MTIKSTYQCTNRTCRATLGWVLSRGARLKVASGVTTYTAGPARIVRCPSCTEMRVFLDARSDVKTPDIMEKMVK